MRREIPFSLAARNALVYFVLFILAIGTLGGLLISYSADEIRSQTENRLSHTAEMMQLKFDDYFKSIEADVRQLAEDPLLEKYMNDPNKENLELLAKGYRTVLNNKVNYFQLRLISIDKEGDELVRVERKGEQVQITPSSRLQNKRNRDYFAELRKVPIDSLYFSKIDLNKEFGKISFPHIPTARVGKRLRGGALNQFIVLVNIDLTFLFNDMRHSLPEAFEIRLLNQDEHYLIHPENEAEFTFEFQQPPYFKKEFNKPIKALVNQKHIIERELDLYAFFKLKYYRTNYPLYGAVSAKKDIVFSSFYTWRNRVIFMSIGIAILFLTMAFFYMRRQVRELKSITTQLTGFSDRVMPQKIAINRKDEIGQLARGFEKMSTEISENHQALTKAQKEAENAAKEKTEFIENLSHEIRNPLQSILGAVQIIEQNQSSPEQKPFVDALKFNTTQLKYLVSDVLDFNKLKENELKLMPKWVDLIPFCNEIIKTSSYQASRKGIQLNIEHSQNLMNKAYFFDPARLYQIINNLLSNALKFTPSPGTVTLHIEAPKEGEVKIAIADSGSGLTAEEKKRILDRNYSTNYNTGAGLGLAIVKDLLALFNSTLTIEDNVSGGSVFSFIMKLEEKALSVDHSLSKKLKLSEDLKVLVVEDDKTQLDWYTYLLKNTDLVCISSVVELKNVSGEFDVIISDVHLGEQRVDEDFINEYYLKRIHQNGCVLLVSGADLEISHPAVYTLKKPISEKDLLGVLTKNHPDLYEIPQFDSFERDYDQQTQLIKNALGILLEQFKKDQVAMEEAIVNKDQIKFGAIQHRIITSLRRLNLKRFESHIDRIAVLIEQDTNIKEEEIVRLNGFYNTAIVEIGEYIGKA